MAQSSAFVDCPVCSRSFVNWTINQHIEECLSRSEDEGPSVKADVNAINSLTGSSKSPDVTQNRKSFKSVSSGSFSRLSNSPEMAESTRSKKSMASFRSPPLKRAKVESSKTAPVVNAQMKGATSKQNDQTARRNKFVPLAEKLRPKTLEEYVGQAKVLGEKSMLKKLLGSHEVPSMIFWGPPGCGKTTLANIIANNTKQASATRFVKLSATMSGVAEVKEVIKIAKNEQSLFQRKTILFIDEIHRFNKMQQDTFLPHVENGTITMIGATTENPSFHVNTALLSRCRVIVLEKLSTENLMTILAAGVHAVGGVVCENAKDISLFSSREIGKDVKIAVEKDSLHLLANLCDGDARNALNGLEMAVQSKLSSQKDHSSLPLITVADTKESFQRSHVSYDRNGEEHYNIISALHKSVRGGDENAALYWLGRMLVGGEDPMYIARRLVRMASEDIGLADPLALNQAVSAFQACHFIGRPECDVILAQASVYLARAPKSVEVYKAYGKVVEHIKSYEGTLPGVPLHLRNAPTKLMKNLGYSKGYKYNPDYDGPVDQEYLPSELKGIDFFKDGK